MTNIPNFNIPAASSSHHRLYFAILIYICIMKRYPGNIYPLRPYIDTKT